MSTRTEQIENLLGKLRITRYEVAHLDGGTVTYTFNLVGCTYNLFTSSWKDFGLHFKYQARRGGKYHQCKIIDFEKNLDRIEQILKPISDWVNERDKDESK